MRTRTYSAIAALLVALTSQTVAQADQPAATTAPPMPTMGTYVSYPGTYVDCCDPCCGGQGWIRGEALWWWTRGHKLPPLVTTSPFDPQGPIPDPNAGVLGEPGTRILFGNDRYNEDGRIGVRLSAGYWFDCDRSCGIEGNIFWLDDEETRFHAESDEDGFPILARPFFDVEQGVQNALLISFPFFVRGSIDISLSTEFHGGEIYLRKNVCQSCTCRLDVLGGFKYLGLEEDLRIDEVEINLGDEAFPIGTRFDLTDQFDTENRFYGGLIGVALETCHGCWTLEVIGAVGLGVTKKEVDIFGRTVLTLPGEDPVVFPGAFLALPTNIGSYDETDFGIVPELHINLGYQVCDCVRAYVGYTFIYWHDVARAGDQIDLRIDPRQFPPAVENGFEFPKFRFKDSDFWAHGLSAGLELRF